jgi:hypothetical protein
MDRQDKISILLPRGHWWLCLTTGAHLGIAKPRIALFSLATLSFFLPARRSSSSSRRFLKLAILALVLRRGYSSLQRHWFLHLFLPRGRTSDTGTPTHAHAWRLIVFRVAKRRQFLTGHEHFFGVSGVLFSYHVLLNRSRCDEAGAAWTVIKMSSGL